MTVVHVQTHEPQEEVANYLIELATQKEYPAQVVEAVRGESDVNLAFRVPDDVAEEFEANRASKWDPEADALVDDDNDPSTPPVRKTTTAKKATTKE